ncbi:MAG: vWA domain-containing protein [Candidatus Acidiferrales bacterium]
MSLRIRRAVTKDVGLAGVMLYVPAILQEAGIAPAWTDGARMYFGPTFFKFSEEEQTGVCIHECLHVVFRHVQRGLAIFKREGSAYRPELWNMACDAVINHSIAQLPWAQLPKHAVELTQLLRPDLLKAKPAPLWTSEQIYGELKTRWRSLPVLPLALANDLNGGQPAHGPGTCWGPDWDDGRADSHQTEMETRIWRERIIRAQAGSHPGGVLRRLASDVPASRIRWELVLREFLHQHCLPTTESSWNRPSRRTLSQGQQARFIEAGNERNKGLARIGVAVDTSGSISDEVLRTFIGEINGIMRVTAAEAVVIDCDAAVQTVRVFRQPLLDYSPRGGGGTDFRPGIAELERQGVTVGVYLTDLCGTFPDRRPSFPLLWAVTQDWDVPFGRRILIPRK